MRNICNAQWSAVLRTHIAKNDAIHLAQALNQHPKTAAAALHYAVEYSSTECLHVALQYCRTLKFHIRKALTQAAEFDSLPMVKILVEHIGKNQNCTTAFAYACFSQNTDMMEVLWDKSKPDEVLEKFKAMGVQKSQVDLLSNFIIEKQAQQQKKILHECLVGRKSSLKCRRKI